MGDPGEGCRERPIGCATGGSGEGEAFIRDAGFFFFVWLRYLVLLVHLRMCTLERGTGGLVVRGR